MTTSNLDQALADLGVFNDVLITLSAEPTLTYSAQSLISRAIDRVESARELIERAIAVNELFAQNLRALRRERGLTQERLAEKAGLHMTDIARIETLRRDPGLRVIAKIAAGLEVPASELVKGI